ncbi:AAA family ATPase [Streptomyces sp. NBC_00234]|uniref:ATP-binding protein n=1 Tax=Streptomyces sp. NBC_00234 TaxID=2903638 RepID=UPI002E28D322|nr:AAA family ATPase [Streptomyces sp. NBC_00234]
MIGDEAPPLRIRLLGGFHAEREGAPVVEHWRRPGARTLVKLLALAPEHRMHREQVMEICRPGATPEAARNNLRVALHTARHALQPELPPRSPSAYLLAKGELLMLAPHLVTVDIDEAERAARAALTGALDLVTRAAALEALERELLPEDPYAEWAASRRAELSLLRDRVRHALADAQLAAGQAEEAAGLMERALIRDPEDEGARERLVRAQRVLGRFGGYAPRQSRAEDPDEDAARSGAGPAAVPAPRYAPGAAPRSPSLPAAIRRAPRTPLVGRDHALRVLTAETGGLPPLTLVAGEAGVGKTRLAGEAARAAHRRGTLVLWGTAHEAEGRTPYGPWADALHAHLAGRPTAERAAIRAAHPELAALVPELGAPVPAVAGPEEERSRLFHAVSGVLTDFARDRPGGVLVVLDDLHDTDLGSLQLLYHLARTTGSQNRRFIAAFREEDLGSVPARRRILDAALGQGLARRLELMRLGEADCARLVAGLAGGLAATDSRLADVFRLSAGNPLFASELAGLIDHGLPSPAAADLGGIGLPEAVRSTVDARLARLSPSARAVVDVLATAGGDVPLSEVIEVAGAALHPPLPPAACAGALDEILVAGLAEERDVVAGGRPVPGYTFRHPLVRLACYGRLTAARRRVLHGAHGDAALGRRREAVDTLALHFVRADDPRAVHWVRRAARRAAALYANDSADRYYRELITLLDASDESAAGAEARHEHALVLRRLARYPEAESALRAALRTRSRAGDHDDAVRTAAALAELLCRAGHVREARTMLDGTPLPEVPLTTATKAVYALATGVVDLHLGRYGSGLAAALRAEEIARGLDPGVVGDENPELLRGRAVGNRAVCLALLGRTDEAEEASRQSLVHAEAAGDAGLLTTVLSMLSQLALDAGRHEEARTFRHRSLRLAERGGDPALIAFERGSLARIDLATGDLAAARAGAAGAIDLVRPFGISWCLAFALAHLVEICLHCGELDEAQEALEECAQLAAESGDAQALDAVRRLTGQLAEARAEQVRTPNSAHPGAC